MRINRTVQRLEAYVPGEQPESIDVVKLNTNENPYPPSPRCAQVLANFDLDRLRRYPDPNFVRLRRAIAARCGCAIGNVFVGNGSDEILALAAKAFVEDGECIASLDPSYSLYKTMAAIRAVDWTGLAALDGGEIVARRAALPERTALFLFTNPNAPTGTFVDPADIARFARGFRGTVLVDEAYADFAPANAMALAVAPDNENLLVMRTFSKSYSLAGLRVGYCVGPQTLIDALYKIKDSYNVDAVAQEVALAAYEDDTYHRETVAKVVAERERLVRCLAVRGWDVTSSAANFVFAAPPAPLTAAAVFAGLRERSVYVRYFPGPLTGSRLRITVGTPAQTERLAAALDDIASTIQQKV